MRAVCVLDASVILNFGAVRGLHVLIDNERYEWRITPLVRGEVRHAESRSTVERAIIEGRIALVELDLSVEREAELWSSWSQRVDAGEAEAIALAEAHDWLVATDDRKAQRDMDEMPGGGRWINSANILLDAVDDDRMAEGDANDFFVRLSSYAGYAKRGITTLSKLRAI
jgi:predicted nucleic acid-binding protein